MTVKSELFEVVTTEDCYAKKKKEGKKNKRKRNWKQDKGDGKEKSSKKQKEEANIGEEMDDGDDDDEHIVFNLEENKNNSNSMEDGQFFNFSSNVYNSDEMDERLIYYQWLADTATTSHVSNRREAFIMYHPLHDTIVSGVGNVKAKAEGRGTVKLISTYGEHKYIIHLQDVLYIPTNRNNLISLGK